MLLTEAPLNPRKNREQAAQILFETFNVPALFISMQAVLSLYASGRTTGVVLDSGDGVTHVVPVYEGFAVQNAVMRMDLAGRDVTDHLQLLLRKAGYNFVTSAEREVIKDIKEKRCYVAYDPQKEEEMLLEKSSKAVYMSYKLPDGNTIEIGPERFRAPEILFDPSIIGSEVPGAAHQLNNSILKTDLDMRKTLYSSIVLSGGTTLFQGFGDRLLREINNLAPKYTKIKIFAPLERMYTTWIGGRCAISADQFKPLSYSPFAAFSLDSTLLRRCGCRTKSMKKIRTLSIARPFCKSISYMGEKKSLSGWGGGGLSLSDFRHPDAAVLHVASDVFE